MPSVTLDSNIWISGLNFRGKPYQLVRMGLAGTLRIEISETIISEVLRVLRQKFQWSADSLREAETQMREIGHLVEPGRTVDEVKADPSDDRILECAVAAGSEFIITGDKHLLQLESFEGVRIVKAAAFLDLTSRGSGQAR